MFIKGCRVELIVRHYANGRTAIMAYRMDGNPYASITVNLPDEPLEEDEIIVKDYSGHEIIFGELLRQGVIHPAHRYVNSGNVTISVCRLKANL